MHGNFPRRFVIHEIVRRGSQRRNQPHRLAVDENLAQHQLTPFALPAVIEQHGSMVVKNEVPPLAQAESGQLLFGACQLPVNIVTEQRVTPARIATDDETGFLGSADGGQRRC